MSYQETWAQEYLRDYDRRAEEAEQDQASTFICEGQCGKTHPVAAKFIVLTPGKQYECCRTCGHLMIANRKING